MGAMPRPRLPYLSRETSRHGRTVWYVRRGGQRVRLRAAWGTPEFDAEYQAALAGKLRPDKGAEDGTLAWLIARYRETTSWTALAPSTRAQRDGIFREIFSRSGARSLATITAEAVLVGRERRAATDRKSVV